MRVEGWSGVDDLTGYLRRVVGPRCHDENDVDDVVQEACIRVARYRGGLSDETSLRPWAARIALNVLAARGGRRARPDPFPIGEALLVPGPEPDADAPPDFLRVGPWLVERGAAVAALRASIAELDEEDRRLLSAFYGAGESCRHAAHVCETTPVLAKVRLFRTRRRLGRLVRRRVALEARAWIAPDGAEHEIAPPAGLSAEPAEAQDAPADPGAGGAGTRRLGLRARRAASARRPGDRRAGLAKVLEGPCRSAAS